MNVDLGKLKKRFAIAPSADAWPDLEDFRYLARVYDRDHTFVREPTIYFGYGIYAELFREYEAPSEAEKSQKRLEMIQNRLEVIQTRLKENQEKAKDLEEKIKECD